MKILLATGIFPTDIGGPATYAATLVPELTRRGHAVTVLTYGKKNKENIPYALIVVPRSYPKGIRHVLYFIKALFLSWKAERVFLLDAAGAGFPGALAAVLMRRKIILRVVGDYAWEQGMQRFGVEDLLDDFLQKKYGFFVWILRRVQVFVARRAKRIIVPSKYLKSVVEQWGIEGEKISIVFNSVSLPEALSREEARRRINISGTVLLSAGRFVPWKGFRMLIELMPELLKKYGALFLVIIGDGPERRALEQVRDQTGVGERVLFPGVVEKGALGAYMAAADVFLLNTAYEGFSHQIVEAMAFGVPVVTTAAGGNREILEHEENALVVSYNEKKEWEQAIAHLLEDPLIGKKIAANGRKSAKQFSIERMVAETESLLQAV